MKSEDKPKIQMCAKCNYLFGWFWSNQKSLWIEIPKGRGISDHKRRHILVEESERLL